MLLDDEVARLRRAAEVDPGDPTIAARLDRALLRAGDPARVMELIRGAVVCRDGLADHDGAWPDGARCSRCGRCLLVATNANEAVQLLGDGLAVAVREGWVEDVISRFAAAGAWLRAQAEQPCLVPFSPARPRPAPPPPRQAWGWSRGRACTHTFPPSPGRCLARRRGAARGVSEVEQALRPFAPGVMRKRHLRRR